MSHNVAAFLRHQSSAQPDAPAVRAPLGTGKNGSIHYVERSFAALEADASYLARFLQERSVARGTRVLLMVKPGLDLIRIVFALFKIGAVPIVIDPGMGLRAFLRCVRHSRPEVVLGIPVAIWVARIARSSFSSVHCKVAVTGRFADRIEAKSSTAPVFPVVDSRADELAAILFTSGSTGPAKGVRYNHGMFAAQVKAIRTKYDIRSGEVDLPMLPVFALFNPALGMTTVVPQMNPSHPATVNPEAIVGAIRQNRVTNSFGSPALWTKIARHCETHDITLPSVRRILMAGAPVPPALMQKMRTIIPNGVVHTPYGATEALPVSSISADEVLGETEALTRQGKGTCVGSALPDVEVRIVDPVDGPIRSMEAAALLPRGEVGEIVVRGPSVTQNYDRLPDEDARSKIPEGSRLWHRMGDLGWMDEAGRLWFCGRKAERVLTNAGPLYTDCCEAIFNDHPKVFRSALIDAGGGCPAIVVEPERGHFPKSEAARQAFRDALSARAKDHAVTSEIQTFFFERSFPVDVRHNAKIHRLNLAKKIQAKRCS